MVKFWTSTSRKTKNWGHNGNSQMGNFYNNKGICSLTFDIYHNIKITSSFCENILEAVDQHKILEPLKDNIKDLNLTQNSHYLFNIQANIPIEISATNQSLHLR